MGQGKVSELSVEDIEAETPEGSYQGADDNVRPNGWATCLRIRKTSELCKIFKYGDGSKDHFLATHLNVLFFLMLDFLSVNKIEVANRLRKPRTEPIIVISNQIRIRRIRRTNARVAQ